jgi:putative ABC transport system permease protein
MLNRSLALGRPITQNDVASQQRVALIGSEAAKLLFKGADPLNNHIVINHQETSTRVKVIGVLKPVNDHRPMATPNLDIIIPYTTMQRRIRRVSLRWVDYIMISAINRDVVPQTVRQVTSIMRMRHNLKPEEANDFTVFDQLSLGNALGKSAQIVSLLLLIIACIALLIGGIGVMNIMLVSVSERTREIGIRMALGATTNQIMIQFLAEAIIICLLGGLVGCILGVTAPYALSGITGWPPVISVSAIITAFIVTTCVGIGAGLYPAYHAAKLDPVAALQEH